MLDACAKGEFRGDFPSGISGFPVRYALDQNSTDVAVGDQKRGFPLRDVAGFDRKTEQDAVENGGASGAGTPYPHVRASAGSPGWSFWRPSLVEIYIFRKVLLRTCAVAVCLSLVFESVQLLGMVSVLFTAHDVLFVTLKFCMLLLPAMLVVMLPFAVLIAVHRTFDEMHEDSELIVMAAVGRSHVQRAAPAIAAGAFFSILTLAVGLWIEPAANRAADRLKANISIDVIGNAAQTGGLKKIGDDILVQVGDIAPDGSFIDVLIVDLSVRNSERIYFAKTGRMMNSSAGSPIMLSDGEILIRSGKSQVASTQLNFTTYSLALFAPRSGGGETRVQSCSTSELFATCGAQGDVVSKPRAVRELHRRFSDWLYVLSFSVIAAWFGSRSRPNRSAPRFGVVGLMILAIVIRGAGFVALQGAAGSTTSTAFLYLIPCLAILLPVQPWLEVARLARRRWSALSRLLFEARTRNCF